jgi:hypothetical protein
VGGVAASKDIPGSDKEQILCGIYLNYSVFKNRLSLNNILCMVDRLCENTFYFSRPRSDPPHFRLK